MANARPRCRVGKTRNIVTIAIGCTTPAANPCNVREKIRISIFGAQAPNNDPAINSATAAMYPPRGPRIEITQAPSNWLAVIAARNAVDIHWASLCPTPKVPMIVGTATFTMVDDRIIVMAAVIPVSATIHLYAGP